MMAPDGGFYTAEDAQVGGVEGKSYIWTRDEIGALLTEAERERLFENYILVRMPDIPSGTGHTQIGRAHV